MSNLNPLLLLEYNPVVAGKKMAKGAYGKVRNVFRRGSKKRYDRIRELPNMRGARRREVINRMYMDADEHVANSGDTMIRYFRSARDARIGRDAFIEDLRRTGEDFAYLGRQTGRATKYVGKKTAKGIGSVGSTLGATAALGGIGIANIGSD